MHLGGQQSLGGEPGGLGGGGEGNGQEIYEAGSVPRFTEGNPHLRIFMIIIARSKIRFSETLGHGWFGWVVSGTVAGSTKVCRERKPRICTSFLKIS